MLFLGWLLSAQPWNHFALLQEDYWVENLTVALFLLTGVLLFFTAAAERSSWRRGVYILGGIVMVFAAGEEISWGQRIFGFATPDFLMSVNRQNEFNVHNIDAGLFGGIYRNGTLLLCTITCAAFFSRKDRLFGIPLPSILLMLCFLLMLSYHREARSFTNITNILYFILSGEKGLLLLFAIYALLSRKSRLFIPAVASLALLIAVSYINYRSIGLSSVGLVYRIQEVREYLFSAVCLFYALELLLAQEAARRRLSAVSIGISGGLRSAGGRLPLPRGIRRRSGSAPAYSKPPALVLVRAFLRSPLLAVCSLVIVGSIGLIPFERFSSSAKDAAIEERYQSIVSGEAAARSTFDIYLAENGLTYAKQPCAAADVEARFFLHIIPADLNDLPDDRKQSRFDNLDFSFNGYLGNGICIITRSLPEYAINRITTGQYIPDEGQLWKAEFPFTE